MSRSRKERIRYNEEEDEEEEDLGESDNNEMEGDDGLEEEFFSNDDDDEEEKEEAVVEDKQQIEEEDDDISTSSTSEPIKPKADEALVLSKSIEIELEKQFKKTKYISGSEKKSLATKLGIKINDVDRWFFYKRKSTA